jgi:glycosyltransferase involved in cell wall biosynthesis
LGFGGVERVQTEYINYLHSVNADFKVILDKDLAEQNVMSEFLKCPVVYLKSNNDVLELEYARANKNKNFLHKIKYNFALNKDRKLTKTRFTKIVNDFQPEIAINFHDLYYFDLSILKNAKTIVWVHSALISPWRNLEKGLKYLKKISEYDLIVCVSKGIMEQIIELAPALTHKTTYLYNPINFERIKKLSDEEFSDEEKELVSKNFLLMVSRLDWGKDFEALFKGFELAKENGYDGELYVIGDGENKDKQKIIELLEKNKFKSNIHLLGTKTNPFNWMKKCDKFILSSKFEGLPTVLIEALTVNDTVISSNCKTGPKEILDEGKIGYLFEVGNSEQLAKLMLEAKPKNRNLINDSLQRFSHKNIMQEFNKIIG